MIASFKPVKGIDYYELIKSCSRSDCVRLPSKDELVHIVWGKEVEKIGVEVGEASLFVLIPE